MNTKKRLGKERQGRYRKPTLKKGTNVARDLFIFHSARYCPPTKAHMIDQSMCQGFRGCGFTYVLFSNKCGSVLRVSHTNRLRTHAPQRNKRLIVRKRMRLHTRRSVACYIVTGKITVRPKVEYYHTCMAEIIYNKKEQST